jgi:hypothetical protein
VRRAVAEGFERFQGTVAGSVISYKAQRLRCLAARRLRGFLRLRSLKSGRFEVSQTRLECSEKQRLRGLAEGYSRPVLSGA